MTIDLVGAHYNVIRDLAPPLGTAINVISDQQDQKIFVQGIIQNTFSLTIIATLGLSPNPKANYLFTNSQLNSGSSVVTNSITLWTQDPTYYYIGQVYNNLNSYQTSPSYFSYCSINKSSLAVGSNSTLIKLNFNIVQITFISLSEIFLILQDYTANTLQVGRWLSSTWSLIELYSFSSLNQPVSSLNINFGILTNFQLTWTGMNAYVVGSLNQFNGVGSSRFKGFIMSVSDSFNTCTGKSNLTQLISYSSYTLTVNSQMFSFTITPSLALQSTTISQVSVLLSSYTLTFSCQINSRAVTLIDAPIQNMTYYAGSITKTQIFDYSQVNPLLACADDQVQYSYSSDLTLQLEQTTSNIEIPIQTNSTSLVGNHLVTIYEQILNGQYFTRPFYVDILPLSDSPCSSAFLLQNSTSFNIIYILGSPSLQVTFPNITVNTSALITGQACPIGSTLLGFPNATFDTTIFTSIQDSITINLIGFLVSTTDATKLGSYQLIYQPYVIDSNQSLSFNYSVYVLNNCASAVINNFTLSDINYDLYSSFIATVDLSGWTHSMSSNTSCPSLTFSIVDTNYVDASMTQFLVTISNSPGLISVNTNQLSQVGSHNFYVKASLIMSGITVSFSYTPLTVNVFAQCNSAVLSGSYADQIYNIGDSVTTYNFSPLTSSVQYCGTLTYSLTLNGQTLSPIYFSFLNQVPDLVNRNILVLSNDLTSEIIFEIKVSASMPCGAVGSYTFLLKFVNPCRQLNYTYSGWTQLVSDKVLNQNLTQTIPLFQASPSLPPICQQQQQISITYSDGTALNTTVYNYTATTYTLIVVPTWPVTQCQNSDQLTVQMSIPGSMSPINANSSISVLFDCGCNNIVVNPIQNYDFSYYLGDPPQTFLFQPFTSNNTYCTIPSFTYAFQNQTTQSVPYKAFITLLKLYPLNHSISVNYSTSLMIEGQVFTVNLMGRTTWGSKTFQAVSAIRFQVLPGCNLPLIRINPGIDGMTYSYKAGDPSLNISFNQYIFYQSYCSFTQLYSLEVLSPLPPPINLKYGIVPQNTTSSMIYIQTVDTSIQGQFTFILMVHINNSIRSVFLQTFSVTITNCQTTSISPSTQKTLYSYTLGGQTLSIPVLPFIMDQDCGFNVSYSMLFTETLSSSQVIQFVSNYNTILISSSAQSDVGQYQIIINGQVTTDQNITLTNLITFKVTIKSPANTAPIFVTSLISLNLIYDSPYSYYLPQIFDNEKDAVSVFLINNPNFVQYQSNGQYLQIYPQSINNIGNYTMQIMLRDNNSQPLQSTYNFELQVSGSQTDQSLQNTPAGQYLQMTTTDYQLDGVTIIKKKLTGSLTATVSEITQFGEVTLKFNQGLFKISNTNPMIYFNALNFFLQKYNGNTTYLNNNQSSSKRRILDNSSISEILLNSSSNWNITKFENDQVSIQLQFSNPKDISTSMEYDRLDIRFNQRYYFVSSDMTKVVQPDYAVNTEVPPQLPNDSATKALQKLASSASSALTGTISINIFLSVVLGLSMKKLWMLIQTLQIIVHLPLLQISLPSNTVIAFQTIIDISNLNIIPKAAIKSFLSAFVSEKTSSAKQNFQQMDIFLFITFYNPRFVNSYTIWIHQLDTKYGSDVYSIDYCDYFRINCFVSQAFLQEDVLLDNSDNDTQSTVITVLMSLYILMMPVFTYLFLKAYFNQLEKQEYIDKFGTLYLTLNEKQFHSLLQVVLYFLRRLSFAFSIVFFGAYPILQAIIQIFWSLGLIMYVILQKPFKSKSDMIFEAFNEISLLSISYLLIVFIEIVNDSDIRYSIGWYVVAITLFNIFVNWLNLVVTLIIGIVQKIKAKLKQRKVSKNQSQDKSEASQKYNYEAQQIQSNIPITQDAIAQNFNSTIQNISTDQFLQETQAGQQKYKKQLNYNTSSFQQSFDDKQTEIKDSSIDQLNLKIKINQEAERLRQLPQNFLNDRKQFILTLNRNRKGQDLQESFKEKIMDSREQSQEAETNDLSHFTNIKSQDSIYNGNNYLKKNYKIKDWRKYQQEQITNFDLPTDIWDEKVNKNQDLKVAKKKKVNPRKQQLNYWVQNEEFI